MKSSLKKTLVVGASEKADRYSNMAIKKLRAHHHPVVAIGNRTGLVLDVPIEKERKDYKDIDSISLYINPKIQKEYYQYLLSLHPKRIIFNPGTENPELEALAQEQGIETLQACTLVMLSLKNY